MKAEAGAEAREIHYEETTWRARPDFSPDGTRMVYASYLGGQWHQLWVMPAGGGDAFPISYGDFDNTNPRWSPDGTKIAFISNRGGNTSLWVQTIPGGAQTQVAARERKYLKPMARLSLKVLGPGGKPVAARVFVTGADGRSYAPDDAWMYADDSFTRSERPFEAHYFDTAGVSEMMVPVGGSIEVGIMRGFEYPFKHKKLEVKPNSWVSLTVGMHPFDAEARTKTHWVSGDVHVHMNYAGTYRNTPKHLVEQAEAENLAIVENLIVNKEQRFPDIAYFTPKPDAASTADHLLLHSQEFHTSYWGHLGLLGLKHNIILPGYAGYPNTAAASLFPANANVADMAHAQGALVGYVHPFEEEPQPLATPPQTITNELPVDVALGKVAYMEIVGFSDHHSTAAVWYRLLNLGFRIPAGAGTDAMANYASLRGPVGMNRVYAHLAEGPVKIEGFLDALKAGRTFATNGPLLDFSLGEQGIGGELKFDRAQPSVPFRAKLQSIVAVDRLELVCNGSVAQTLALNATRDGANVTGTLALKESGWCVLRASSDKAEYPVLDNYVYATTSPIYVTIGGKKPRSPEDAKYFVAWIERVMEQTERYPDWNSTGEREYVVKKLEEGKRVYEGLR